jgi:hypothetical protein
MSYSLVPTPKPTPTHTQTLTPTSTLTPKQILARRRKSKRRRERNRLRESKRNLIPDVIFAIVLAYIPPDWHPHYGVVLRNFPEYSGMLVLEDYKKLDCRNADPMITIIKSTLGQFINDGEAYTKLNEVADAISDIFGHMGVIVNVESNSWNCGDIVKRINILTFGSCENLWLNYLLTHNK